MGNSNINPNLSNHPGGSHKSPGPKELVEKLRKGDRVALSRAITKIESRQKKHFEDAREIVESCLPHSGKSIRIGITGVPGVGKSSFIETFGMHLVDQGKKLAVLAIDPSSSVSKGSILGDKTRMENLSVHPNAFIRPSAAGDTLGGVARATRESILLCEAAGYDYIIVETVGVGQSETAVHGMTDVFLLLMLAGAGDELQGIKRGIMELTDLLLINKADGQNLEKAKRARQEYARAIHFFPPHPGNWTPRTGICSALENSGIKEVESIIKDYQIQTQENGYWTKKRKDQNRFWFESSVQFQFMDTLKGEEKFDSLYRKILKEVEDGKTSAFTGSYNLVQSFLKA